MSTFILLNLALIIFLDTVFNTNKFFLYCKWINLMHSALILFFAFAIYFALFAFNKPGKPSEKINCNLLNKNLNSLSMRNNYAPERSKSMNTLL